MTAHMTFGWRASLGGRVKEATGWPSSRARVTLSRGKSDVPLRVACVRPDGWYAFFDLSAGTYVLGGVDAAGRPLSPARVRVPAAEAGRPPHCAFVDMQAASGSAG